MKSTRPFFNERIRRWATVLGAFAAAWSLPAAETNAPPAATEKPLSPEEAFEGGTQPYNNWIDLSTGGAAVSGSKSRFQQQHQTAFGPYGGIEDFHYQRDLNKTTTVTADGHALFDQDDYKLTLGITREKLGYLRFSYNEFRTWYDANGGFFPPTESWFPMRGDGTGLDRGEISFEGGLALENAPKVTFKYTHNFREGEKGSTLWGGTHPGGGPVRDLSPSFYDINEHSDAIQVDVEHHIKATQFGLGVRYENGKLDDALKIDQYPNEGVERKITDSQGTTYDLFNVHAFTETWIKKNLLFSSGYSFSDMESDFTGSRIYGSDFDVGYVPGDLNGFGYYGLNGQSSMQEYVMDLNLMAKPGKNFTIVPSIRAQKSDFDAHFTGASETLGVNPAQAFDGTSDRSVLDVRERLDLRYTGVTNWVFNVRGEWTEGQGNLFENGGLGAVNGFGVPPINRQTDDSRLLQKYNFDARWYASRKVTLDWGGYYKLNRYDYDNNQDSTANDSLSPDRYPAYLVMQNFETYDGNFGVTLRPWQKVAFVTRYEYQLSTIHTRPDPVSGLSDAESSKMTSHIIAENASWSPWSRLNLQAGFNYVLSETRTPVSDYVPPGWAAAPVLAAQNNYWTLNFNSGLVLDDKTDLNLGYFYYRADDYSNNSAAGVPYGAGAEEHGVTATLVRRISQHVRLTLKYGYYTYSDETFGGRNDFNAHVFLATLRYRF